MKTLFYVEQSHLRQQVSAQMIYDFLLQHNNNLFPFVSERAYGFLIVIRTSLK